MAVGGTCVGLGAGVCNAGAYTQILATSTLSTFGQGYQSSGDINVPLVAGRYYAIGVGWPTTVPYWYHATGMTAVSFGTMLGGSMKPVPPLTTMTYSTATTYYTQRLTTGP
jgi:hypothetical protein